ncbi:MAG: hypothetical protein CVU12_08615, partial [Bacteroidetes bacterium HGW-Bacteroidetes-7]
SKINPLMPIIILVFIMILEVIVLTQMSKCNRANLPILIALTLFIVILISILLFKNNEKNLLIKLISNFKGEAGDWYGILSIFYVVINLNIAGESCWDVLDNPSTFSASGIKTIIICEFLLLPFLFKAPPITPEKTSSKVFITGVSLPSLSFFDPITEEDDLGGKSKTQKKPLIKDTQDTKFINKLNSYASKDSLGLFDYYSIAQNKWGRWDGIRKSLSKNTAIETVVLILSEENISFFNKVELNKNELDQNWNLASIIEAFQDRGIKVITSKNVDVNDIEDVKSEIERLLSSKVLAQYNNEDILFGILGSTAVVSAAMILSSLKGQRRAEYIHQINGSVCEINLDVLSVQELWDEILVKMQERSMGNSGKLS